MCHLRLNLWLQKLTETLWSLLPVELPGVPLWIIFTNKKVIPATGIHFRKVRLAFCRFSCQRTERWQSHCSKTHSPGRATSWQVLLVRHRCSLANVSGRVEFYTPVKGIFDAWKMSKSTFNSFLMCQENTLKYWLTCHSRNRCVNKHFIFLRLEYCVCLQSLHE